MNHVAALELIEALHDRGFKLALAESITGGALAAELVSVPGASKVLAGSVVAYDTNLKRDLLAVPASLLKQHGAVHPDVAVAMAEGAHRLISKAIDELPSNVVGLATTGVAGPDQQDGVSVGTAFIAVTGLGAPESKVFEHVFLGDRNEIRSQCVAASIEHLLDLLRQ